MVSFKSSTIRSIGIAVVATGLLLSSAIGASADTRSGSYATLPSSPPPANQDLKGPTTVRDDVVIGVITPEQRRSNASDDLKADTGTARGGDTPHTSVDDFKGGPGCSIQCITSGVAHARGAGANLVVKTDTPAKIWIIVWNDDGYHKQVNSDEGETEFAHHFDDLEPATFYYAMAAAEDGEGYTSHGSGDFTTLTRNVRVSFTQAVIHEKPFSGPYAMTAWLQGQEIADNDNNVQEGDIVPIGIQIHELEGVERFLSLEVFLLLFDSSEDLCESFGDVDEPSIGMHDCYAWAYAEFQGGELDLDDRPAGAGSWTQHTIEQILVLPGGNALPGGYGEPFAFSVPVGIEVTYE
jgi:hypothetical protein